MTTRPSVPVCFSNLFQVLIAAHTHLSGPRRKKTRFNSNSTDFASLVYLGVVSAEKLQQAPKERQSLLFGPPAHCCETLAVLVTMVWEPVEQPNLAAAR
jgi:hypothetical protein